MFGHNVGFIEKVMDYSHLRRKTISDNISNYNTPNYKRKEVDFDLAFNSGLQSNMRRTQSKHIGMSDGANNDFRIYKDPSTKERTDGNNVDLNIEMIEMVKNNSLQNKSIQAINHQFSKMKVVMSKK